MNKATPKYGHDPIPMRRVTNMSEVEKAGDFCFSSSKSHIGVAVPSNPVFEFAYVPITGEKGWEWDGNEERPTLTPSVHTVGHWHGWIRNGQMVEA